MIDDVAVTPAFLGIEDMIRRDFDEALKPPSAMVCVQLASEAPSRSWPSKYLPTLVCIDQRGGRSGEQTGH
jgi:hypothetical protein